MSHRGRDPTVSPLLLNLRRLISSSDLEQLLEGCESGESSNTGDLSFDSTNTARRSRSWLAKESSQRNLLAQFRLSKSEVEQWMRDNATASSRSDCNDPGPPFESEHIQASDHSVQRQLTTFESQVRFVAEQADALRQQSMALRADSHVDQHHLSMVMGMLAGLGVHNTMHNEVVDNFLGHDATNGQYTPQHSIAGGAMRSSSRRRNHRQTQLAVRSICA